MAFSVTTDFSAGTVAKSSEVNANFEDVEDEINGSTFTNTKGILRYAASDLTGGNIDNSTTETQIGQATIAANSVGTGILIIVTGEFQTYATTSSLSTVINIYTGSDGDIATDTARVTKTVYATGSQNDTSGGTGTPEKGYNNWTFTHYETSETWTATSYVTVSGTNSSATTGQITTCYQIIVFGW